MAKKIKRSPGPYYCAAAVWVVWGLFCPLYKMLHLLAVTALSVIVFLRARSFFPDQVYETPDPVVPETTGDERIDALLRERDRALEELERLKRDIPDPAIGQQIDHLQADTRKIIDHVKAHPEKLSQIRKFTNYYLPTTLKLLNAYDRMDDTGISGSNIDTAMGKIGSALESIVTAFDRQLDALFADEALDISTDITVMEDLLRQEGLLGEKEQTPFAQGG